ncbi:GH17829 [Drosophila grimshawi]|uniref:GH17829 n=1 Tax=Drosophila grimshawi TaxID=7222 RepID=B4JWW3_DROGR|nr:GH17829 [Drosophila grimshawi]
MRRQAATTTTQEEQQQEQEQVRETVARPETEAGSRRCYMPQQCGASQRGGGGGDGRRLENPYVRFAVSSIICFGFVRMDEHKDAGNQPARTKLIFCHTPAPIPTTATTSWG